MVWRRLRSWYGDEVKSGKALLAYRYTSLSLTVPPVAVR